MSALLTDLGLAVTAMLGNVTDVATSIVSTPIMLIPSAAFLLGVSIKFFKRML